jgi:ABC-type sugar transport system permease subunit
LALALIFTVRMPAQSLLRTIYYLPCIIPAVVFAIVWRFMFHPYGVVNYGLTSLGLPQINWLTDPDAVIPALIFSTDTRLIPFFMIIYLTAILNIPREYYDAASIDGANWLQQFWYITLPLIRPIILLVVIVSIITLSKVFTSVLILTGGGPNGASRVIPMFVYEMGLQYFKMGRASAASMFLLVALMVFTMVQLRVFKDREDVGARA